MTVQIAMTDRNGIETAGTLPFPPGLSVADRVHFRAQLDPARNDLFISQPVLGRASGQQTIQFSRKLLTPNGGFGGIIVLSLGSVELANFYEAMGLGGGFVSILSTDGTVLARGPSVPGLVGTNVKGNAVFETVLRASSGSIRMRDTPAQVQQIASFRHLLDYPIIVMVGFDTPAVFKAYHSRLDSAVLTTAAANIATGLIGIFWVRQTRRSISSMRVLTVTLDTISQGVVMVDHRGGMSVINHRVADLLALPDEAPETSMKFAASRAAELIPWSIGLNTEPGVGLADNVTAAATDGKYETELDNGTIIDVRTHLLPDGGYVQTYTDITEQRSAHAKVEHLAHHDALTGLANRVALRLRLLHIVDPNSARDGITALLMIDLDGFKAINDTLGHAAGDALLVEVARRLKVLARGADLVGRLGGDEFVIVAAGMAATGDVVPLAQRVLRRLAEPIDVLGQQVRIGASVGVAFHPQDATDVDTLFKHADVALYSAKTGGRGIYRCFDEQLTHAVTEARLLESDLRGALDAGTLELHFQPKFETKSLRVVGFEALARWHHPTRGYISPDVFIRIAEGCGLIDRLGRWVLGQACANVATWEPRVPVAVNVSVLQLHDGALKDDVAAVLLANGLGPEWLEIEVTESVLANDDQTVLRNLQVIKAMGIRIALDDFGTGYSSLSYLRRFSFDKIKIDKSFVQGQADDPGVRVILEAILGMCNKLGLATVAEGVETLDQLELLRSCHCTEIQGYLLGRPIPGDAVQAFMRNQPTEVPSSSDRPVLAIVL